MGFKSRVMGVITIILAAALLYTTAYQVTAWVNIMPDTYLKTLFWVGYIGQVVMAIFIKPYMMIAKDDDNSTPLSLAQGALTFITGLVFSLILWELFDAFFGTYGAFQGDSNWTTTMTDIMWFLYTIVTVLGIVVIPLYVAYEEPATKKIEEAVRL